MKTFFVGLLVLTPFAAIGCGESDPPESNVAAPTSPNGASTSENEASKPVKTVAKKPIQGEADNTFSLSVPFESIALTQGEEKSLLIGINRGEDFREQVAVEVSELPTGVTLETADPVIKPGSTDVTLKLKAAADASLGDFTFTVTGNTASSGADFSKEVKLTVSKIEAEEKP